VSVSDQERGSRADAIVALPEGGTAPLTAFDAGFYNTGGSRLDSSNTEYGVGSARISIASLMDDRLTAENLGTGLEYEGFAGGSNDSATFRNAGDHDFSGVNGSIDRASQAAGRPSKTGVAKDAEPLDIQSLTGASDDGVEQAASPSSSSRTSDLGSEPSPSSTGGSNYRTAMAAGSHSSSKARVRTGSAPVQSQNLGGRSNITQVKPDASQHNVRRQRKGVVAVHDNGDAAWKPVASSAHLNMPFHPRQPQVRLNHLPQINGDAGSYSFSRPPFDLNTVPANASNVAYHAPADNPAMPDAGSVAVVPEPRSILLLALGLGAVLLGRKLQMGR
jgi:hypothetical protein